LEFTQEKRLWTSTTTIIFLSELYSELSFNHRGY
jgi:hypothetical protein